MPCSKDAVLDSRVYGMSEGHHSGFWCENQTAQLCPHTSLKGLRLGHATPPPEEVPPQ